MEVASPLAFVPAGSKRSLACSPQLMQTTNHSNNSGEDLFQRSHKRRRFHADTSVESLSNAFAAPSTFFNNPLQSHAGLGSPLGSTSKRSRNGSPVQPDTAELQIIVQKQAAEIDALQKEKKTTEESMQSLKSEHERTVKENHVLRRAVQIQSDRQNETDKELKEAHKYKVDAEERIKKLEHMIVALRYHLQAQQAPVANDFLNQRPPDVY